MRITRSTLRRLIAEESARLLREAAEEESTATNEAERGKKGHGKKHSADCLYVLYGGRGVYYYTAPCGLSEEEAAEKGHDVTDDVAGGEDMADPLSLYDWLQRHDEITAVYDDESAGGEISKDDFMGQLRDVGEEEGLFADEDDVNEGDEPLDETEDQHYNDDLQSRLGHFTTPENVKGTPQHKEKHAPPAGGTRSGSGYVSRRSEWGDADLYGGPPRVDEGAFPEELEGVYGEEPPEFDEESHSDDSFMDYDPEEIPDMDDQYDPEYYEGLDDEEDDDAWMDYETGDDDVPYGAADVALRKGRGHRTDEGHDHDSDPDGGYVGFMASDEEMDYLRGGGSYSDGPYADSDDRDAPEANRYERSRKKNPYPVDDIDSGNEDEGVDSDSLSEARWAKLAGILKG